MFPELPTLIDELRGGSDAAPFVDAAVGWARVEAASAAQRFAGMAEWATVFLADEDDDSVCAVDAEDDVVAQIGIAFGVSKGRAFRDLQVGAAMRLRFPKLAAMFLRGEVSAQVMTTVVERTLLVVDADVLAQLDDACVEAAALCGWSGLSYYSLKNAVDVWVDRFDPDAVRRVRNSVRGRGVSVEHTDDKAGVMTIRMRLTKPGGALLMGTLRSMAKAVCAEDPRTFDQRMADAAEALHAGSRHLKCLCGSDTCSAAADDGVASMFVVHIYGDAELLEAQPDPLIHGDGVFPTAPDNVTIKYPGKRSKSDAANGTVAESEVGATAGPEPVDESEAAVTRTEQIPHAQNDIDDDTHQAAAEAGPDADPQQHSSTPRHCAAPAAPEGEPPAGGEPEPGADEEQPEPEVCDNREPETGEATTAAAAPSGDESAAATASGAETAGPVPEDEPGAAEPADESHGADDGAAAAEPVDEPEAADAPTEPIAHAQNDIGDDAPDHAAEFGPDADQQPGSSAPRHCAASAAAEAEPSTGDKPEAGFDEEAEATEEQSDAGSVEAKSTAAVASAVADNTSATKVPTTGLAPGFIPGYGVVPNALIAALIAAGADVRHIKPPSVEPTESYRLRDCDREFVQARDLACRIPGCDRPIHDADLDHTISWDDGGPTHPSNEKGYCRHHHLMKTFRDGWSEVQHADGTIEITTPTGHTYTSIPLSRILFPRANTTSAPVQRGSPRKRAAADKSAKMPKRKRSKARDRAYRIQAERALNAAYRASGGATPVDYAAAPKDDFGYRLFFGEYTQQADPNDPPPF